MSLRSERTAAAATVLRFERGPGGINSNLRNPGKIAAMQAMAEDVGRQLLEEHDGQPGFFPYTPDPIAEELINSAFKRGVELGRRLERQDAGQIVSIVSPSCTGEHDDGPTPPAHGRTGLWVSVALILFTCGYFIARMIIPGGAA